MSTPKRRCEACGRSMSDRQHRQTHPSTGQKVCPSCMGMESPMGNPTYASQHVAHDSGDGADVNHCPFCGSGAVIGSHSGTITCEYCKKNFTVQVQPEFRSMPQTVNGQPYNIPGMPGGGPDAGASAEEKTQQVDSVQPGAAPKPADPAAPAPGAGPDEDSTQPKNPFAAHSMLLTSEGAALSAGTVMQRLALEFADDREAVLTQVRAENTRT